MGGVNGVGKTTLTHEVCDKLNCRMVDGSALLMKELKIPGDYIKLRLLGEFEKSTALESIFKSLKRKSGTVLFTGHFVKILAGEISSSKGPWYQYCSALISIEGSPRAMAARIYEDEVTGFRTGRNLFSTQTTLREQARFLRQAQNVSRTVMVELSQQFSIPYYSIFNEEKHKEIAIKKLCHIVSEFL